MSIANVYTGTTGFAVADSNPASTIKALEKQIESLQKQISTESENKTDDAQTQTQVTQLLEVQIQALTMRIQVLQSQQAANKASEPSPASEKSTFAQFA
jgi:hypothetical protein